MKDDKKVLEKNLRILVDRFRGEGRERDAAELEEALDEFLGKEPRKRL
jgi:hypothetical protein